MRNARALEPLAPADDSFAAVDELLEISRPSPRPGRLVLPKYGYAANTLAWILGSWIVLVAGVGLAASVARAGPDLRALFGLERTVPSESPVHLWRSILESGR